MTANPFSGKTLAVMLGGTAAERSAAATSFSALKRLRRRGWIGPKVRPRTPASAGLLPRHCLFFSLVPSAKIPYP